MKKICFLLCLLFSFPVFSQTNSSSDVLKNIQGISAYNATIIGYAMYCDFPKDKVQLVNGQFISILNQINLSNTDYDATKKIFFETLKTAKERGPQNSNMTCAQFQPEFNKIFSTIQTGQNK